METKTQRVNLFLDPVIVEKAKIRGIKNNISLSRMVNKALALYLKEK